MNHTGNYVYFKTPYGTLAARELISNDVRDNLVKQGVKFTEHMGGPVWTTSHVLQPTPKGSAQHDPGACGVVSSASHDRGGNTLNKQVHTLRDTLDMRNYLPIVVSLTITPFSGWYVEKARDYSWLHGLRICVWKFLFRVEWRDLRPWRTR